MVKEGKNLLSNFCNQIDTSYYLGYIDSEPIILQTIIYKQIEYLEKNIDCNPEFVVYLDNLKRKQSQLRLCRKDTITPKKKVEEVPLEQLTAEDYQKVEDSSLIRAGTVPDALNGNTADIDQHTKKLAVHTNLLEGLEVNKTSRDVFSAGTYMDIIEGADRKLTFINTMPLADLTPYQKITDHKLTTTAKTIPLAINENSTNIELLRKDLNNLTEENASITVKIENNPMIIQHGLQHKPLVQVIDDNGTLCQCEIYYLEDNIVSVSWNGELTGNIYLK